MAKLFVLKSIRFYQHIFSLRNPLIRILLRTDTACRFTPTCSDYTYQAVEKHGIIGGLLRGLKRILRCHPWSKGGVDPVT